MCAIALSAWAKEVKNPLFFRFFNELHNKFRYQIPAIMYTSLVQILSEMPADMRAQIPNMLSAAQRHMGVITNLYRVGVA